MKKCIVMCAGEFTPVDIGKSEKDMVIAVDGGYGWCREAGLEPDLIIGDFDSITEEQRAEIRAIKKAEPKRVFILQQEKDDTDTMAALRFGLDRGFREFYLYGAMGGRLDHTIANIQCLIFLKNRGAAGYLIEKNTMAMTASNERVIFSSEARGRLSLFALEKKVRAVTISGMKYPLDRVCVTDDYPVGISNEFIGEKGFILVENGIALILTEGEDKPILPVDSSVYAG